MNLFARVPRFFFIFNSTATYDVTMFFDILWLGLEELIMQDDTLWKELFYFNRYRRLIIHLPVCHWRLIRVYGVAGSVLKDRELNSFN